MSRRALLLALLCLLLAYLGSRRDPPFGIDAVSAVTPGRVSVVGAVAAAGAGSALSAAQVEEMVRKAVYLSGGMHKAIDPAARWIVVKIADLRAARAESGGTQTLDPYLAAVRVIVGLLHQAAGEARFSLTAGAAPVAEAGSGNRERGESARETGETALEKLAADLVASGIEVDLLDLATEETERAEVPDGGEAAAEYAVPIAILECDSIVNVAPYSRRGISGLANLVGMAANDGTARDDDAAADSESAADEVAQLVDLALLAEVDYTLLTLLGTGGASPRHPRLDVILAGHDPTAVDRISLEITAADTSYLAALRLASSRRLGTADLPWIKVNGMEVGGSWKESGRESSAAE